MQTRRKGRKIRRHKHKHSISRFHISHPDPSERAPGCTHKRRLQQRLPVASWQRCTGGYPSWARSVDDVASHFQTYLATGLGEADVAERRERYGWNELAQAPGPGLWALVRAQLGDTLVQILIGPPSSPSCSPSRTRVEGGPQRRCKGAE